MVKLQKDLQEWRNLEYKGGNREELDTWVYAGAQSVIDLIATFDCKLELHPCFVRICKAEA